MVESIDRIWKSEDDLLIHVIEPFDAALMTLRMQGYRFISLPESARLRIVGPENFFMSRFGNSTREGVIYFPNGKPKLVRNSPILYSAEEAMQAHRNENEFYPSKDQIDQALVDSIDFPQENIKIPTNRLSEEALTVWAFGGESGVGAFGKFLRDLDINKMPVYTVDEDYVKKQEKPFARQMFFKGMSEREEVYWFIGGLGGSGSGLSGNYKVHISDLFNGLYGVNSKKTLLERLKQYLKPEH